VFPPEIDDAPATVALLQMLERQRRHFRSSESAAEKHREYGAIPQAPNRCDIGRVEKTLRWAHGKPVPDPDSHRLRALHAADAGG
jgi:hypothetical protein